MKKKEKLFKEFEESIKKEDRIKVKPKFKIVNLNNSYKETIFDDVKEKIRHQWKKGYVPVSIAVFPNRINGWWFSVCLVFEHRKAVEYCIEKYTRKKSWRDGLEKKMKKGWIPSGTFIYQYGIAQKFVR